MTYRERNQPREDGVGEGEAKEADGVQRRREGVLSVEKRKGQRGGSRSNTVEWCGHENQQRESGRCKLREDQE